MADVTSNKLFLKILSKEAIVYEGVISSLSSMNEVGKFDVLERHTNFVTVVEREIVAREPGGGTRSFPLSEAALMSVRNGQIHVFL